MHTLGKLATLAGVVDTLRESMIYQCFDHYVEIVFRVRGHAGAKMTIYTCRNWKWGPGDFDRFTTLH